ncbi:hypothetical protein HZC34_02290 [Candidatus Saganbacteria bacterium]|nr:hypothetical protein [Candidatus Saganbacteria bacterium]
MEVNPYINHGAIPNIKQASSVNKEFLAMFYKEILKEGFSGEFMGMNEGSQFSQMTKDVFIEKLSKELSDNTKKI